jgi:hypothetical protein
MQKEPAPHHKLRAGRDVSPKRPQPPARVRLDASPSGLIRGKIRPPANTHPCGAGALTRLFPPTATQFTTDYSDITDRPEPAFIRPNPGSIRGK